MKCKANLSARTWAKLNPEEQAIFNLTYDALSVHAHNTAFSVAFDLRRQRQSRERDKKTPRRHRA